MSSRDPSKMLRVPQGPMLFSTPLNVLGHLDENCRYTGGIDKGNRICKRRNHTELSLRNSLSFENDFIPQGKIKSQKQPRIKI